MSQMTTDSPAPSNPISNIKKSETENIPLDLKPDMQSNNKEPQNHDLNLDEVMEEDFDFFGHTNHVPTTGSTFVLSPGIASDPSSSFHNSPSYLSVHNLSAMNNTPTQIVMTPAKVETPSSKLLNPTNTLCNIDAQLMHVQLEKDGEVSIPCTRNWLPFRINLDIFNKDKYSLYGPGTKWNYFPGSKNDDEPTLMPKVTFDFTNTPADFSPVLSKAENTYSNCFKIDKTNLYSTYSSTLALSMAIEQMTMYDTCADFVLPQSMITVESVCNTIQTLIPDIPIPILNLEEYYEYKGYIYLTFQLKKMMNLQNMAN
jgi:hypothetical protein